MRYKQVTWSRKVHLHKAAVLDMRGDEGQWSYKKLSRKNSTFGALLRCSIEDDMTEFKSNIKKAYVFFLVLLFDLFVSPVMDDFAVRPSPPPKNNNKIKF
ncbi:hypothetical protein AVEN_200454-1 [Araneus ventricosus]|uniref:Uncharacterized protein n=1 Tax=Araneus ventricosus TaxID=182803 RepID=A0A4Y2JH17_ARAVE|nr:hypothetical protein AVEN_200454-1 [Araneus ventricosus]